MFEILRENKKVTRLHQIWKIRVMQFAKFTHFYTSRINSCKTTKALKRRGAFLENSPIRLSISFKIVLVSSSVVFASEGSEWGGEEKAQPWNNKRGNIVVKKISRWNHSSEKYFAATQIISEFWPKSLIYLDDFWKGGASSANSVVKIGRWRYFNFSGKKSHEF